MLIKKILDVVRNIDINETDIDRAIKYLQAYKYLKANDFTPGEFLKAILEFQKNFGLDTEGFSLQTLEAMAWKRCGCPDLVAEEASENNKWAFTHLKYYIEDFVPGLTKDEQRFLTKEAANDASDVCGLTFEEVSNSNQANIVLRTGKSNGLGTSGEVLAYAYLPSGPNHTRQLEVVFDLADLWVKDKTKRGILYKNVAAHETFSGHNVGLSHSNVKTALLAPFYDRDIDKPQRNDDIPRLQSRYGKPKVIVTPPVNPPVQPPQDGEKEFTIKIIGNLKDIQVEGYRLYKM